VKYVRNDVDDGAPALSLSLSSIARDSVTRCLNVFLTFLLLDDSAGISLSWAVIIKEAVDTMRHYFLRKMIKQRADKMPRVRLVRQGHQ